MTPDARSDHGRRWLGGLLVSILALAVLLEIGLATQSFGFAFVLGVPLVCGYLIGRWVRVAPVLRILCALMALAGVIAGAVTASMAGAVCGAVFFAIACIPLLIGVFVGGYMYGRRWAPNSIASVALIALVIPLEHSALPSSPLESVSTSEVIPMSADAAFSRITFYEDTTGEPPRILRIALPRPLRTLGEADSVGDRPRCIYDVGYIVKEITVVDQPTFYAFRVIEQVGVESHAVKLTNGSFRLEPVGRSQTRVVLTTSYVPKLTARLAWRPFEQAVIHALHRHVLREMMSPQLRGRHA